jgi:hypothetical protein
MIERVKPFIDRAMRERYQPVETARRAQQTLSELFGVVTSMPLCPATQLKREWSPWLEFGWSPGNLRDFQRDNFSRRF